MRYVYMIKSSFKSCFQTALCLSVSLFPSLGFSEPVSHNQTPTITPIITNGDLPFHVEIEQADFSLPNGIHSYVHGIYKGKWFFVSGRTNGLHDFDSGNNNFPPQKQNKTLYVVDPKKKQVWSRELDDSRSGLTQKQIDELSVTSAQAIQRGKTLYLIGGYGVKTSTGEFSTKKTLTAIDLDKAIEWVTKPSSKKKFVHAIRQTSNSQLRVTGGYSAQQKDHPSLLMLGQDFEGYYLPSSNGQYTEVVRRFRIKDNGKKVRVDMKSSKPSERKSEYRRRDLNIVPVMYKKGGTLRHAHVAYSGVFTPSGGAWTVPVEIDVDGKPSMADPESDSTFKQGMNNYACATAGFYSHDYEDMYTLFFGGISYGYFDQGVFQTDSEFPFINQVTAIRINKEREYSQYLLDAEYPVILSTGSNPGNQLLFGSACEFIPAQSLDSYSNGVLKFDRLKIGKTITLGYIVGGIQSTLPNTNSGSDSAASPYIFKVKITRTR